jgi:hypothetical protein
MPVAIPQQIAVSNCLAQKRGQARSALAGDGEEWWVDIDQAWRRPRRTRVRPWMRSQHLNALSFRLSNAPVWKPERTIVARGRANFRTQSFRGNLAVVLTAGIGSPGY